ncbi:putative NOP5 family protein [Candidatus Tiddalikarchaeum anstoanum]|nr:putative NOP5 family protein [Candidatus Tiddalikarchaeum anstoanum]
MKELVAVLRKKDINELGDFCISNKVAGSTPISEVVPSIFKTIDEYKNFLRDFAIKNASKRIKKELNVDDEISVYSDFADVVDELINSWFERVFELFTIYYPEASLKVQELPQFLKLEKLDRSTIAAMFKVNPESMGIEFEQKDVKLLDEAIKVLKSLNGQKDDFGKRVEELVNKRAPNTAIVASPLIAGKLISMAGGLHRLALMPSSTIQVIGAEKALFRHLRGKAKPPKHGIISQSPIVATTPLKHKGKMARALASKISIAAKVDYFKGSMIGDKLVKELEAKRSRLR